MKKLNSSKICYIISILLLFGFIINTIIDYSRYNSTLNSAPFNLWILVNILYFIVPAISVFLVGYIIKLKQNSN